MALLKLTVPGVPDIYQGAEFWEQSLVDPDNRRPVDFTVRQRALTADGQLDELIGGWRDGRLKQQMIATVLALRANPRTVILDLDLGRFGDWLASKGKIGLSGIDTRALTRRIRDGGAPTGVVAHSPDGQFDIVWDAGQAQEPFPFPSYRLRDEWLALLRSAEIFHYMQHAL